MDLDLKGLLPSLLEQEMQRRGYFVVAPSAMEQLPHMVFDTVQGIHEVRNKRWQGAGPGYTALEKAAEMGGEAGELAEEMLYLMAALGRAQNETKKLRRVELNMPGNKPDRQTVEQCKSACAAELGDVVITAFNLANKIGVSLFAATRAVFNHKSEQLGFPERL